MMSRAFTPGGLRPVEALPPTLTPNAVLAMAAPRPRALSFLGACVAYAGCAAAVFLAPRLQVKTPPPLFGSAHDMLIQDPTEFPSVHLRPDPPPPVRALAPMLKNAPQRDANWKPPTETTEVPVIVPTTVPTKSRAMDSAQGGDPAGIAVPTPGTGLPVQGAPVEHASSVVAFDFRQMRVATRVDPIYPSMAKAAHIQGEVQLLMVINEQGVPTSIKALSSPHPSLEQEALRVARLWRFEPALMNGQPVQAQFRLVLNFRLK
ncbi:MAG: energy transducer TonB [Firmicutes bacterium]|nr:energy transducer TonB [Bacillota bacterium]